MKDPYWAILSWRTGWRCSRCGKQCGECRRGWRGAGIEDLADGS